MMGKRHLWIVAAIIITTLTFGFGQQALALGATATASPSTISQGQTSQLNVSVTGASGTAYYSWSSVPPGFISTTQNPVVAPNVTTTYTVQVFNAGVITYSSVTVVVTAATGLVATASATPSTITAGQTSQLDCNVTGASGSITYSWTSSPAGFTSSLKNPVVTPTVNTTYTCAVGSGTLTTSASTSVTVTPLLNATLTATPQTINTGQSSQLNAIPTGGTGTYTYSWTSDPAGFTSTLKNPVVTPTDSTWYICNITSGNQTIEKDILVNVNGPVAVTVTATPQGIIAGQTSQLNANPTGGTGTYTYAWSSNPTGFTSILRNPVVTPSVTTSYTCVVTSGQQTANASVSVEVTPLLTATASATPATIIAGQSSQLNCTATGASGTYSYSWTSNPAGFTSNLKNPVVSPNVTTTYSCVVSSAGQNITTTTTVTVNPGTGLTASATATPSTINAGQSSQLNCTAAGGAGNYTYSWTSNPAGFTSTSQSPSVTPTATTTYTCVVTSGTQTATASATVNVGTAPALLSATATATPATISAGQTSQLNCIPTGGNGTYTYSWTSNPAGFTSTNKTPVVSPSTTTIYTCTVTSGTQTTTATATVQVNAPAGLVVTSSATPSNINPGQSSQLNCNATGGNGTYSYAWTSNPAGFTSSLQNPVVNPATNTTYSCTVTSGTSTGSCSTTVTINISPITASATANPTAIRVGQSSQLNCIATGGTGTYTYSWTSSPAGFTSTLRNPVVSPKKSTVYTVVVSDGNTTATASVKVKVYGGQHLTLAVSTDNSTICQGEDIHANATPEGGSLTYTYLWTSMPAGFTSTDKDPVVTPNQSMRLICEVNDGDTTVTATTDIIVNQAPTVKAGNDTTVGQEQQEIKLRGVATNSSRTEWATDGDGTFADASSLKTAYTPGPSDLTRGSVTLRLTANAAAPCFGSESSSMTITFTTAASVTDPEAKPYDVTVYPNPTPGLVHIKFTGKTEGEGLATVTDVQGKVLEKRVMRITEGSEISFDLSSYPSGIYFITVDSDNLKKTHKVIHQ